MLVLQAILFGLQEVLVVATVSVQPLRVQVDDVCRHSIQEVSVVGDDQDGGLPRLRGTSHSAHISSRLMTPLFPMSDAMATDLQVVLQPQNGFDVQHVGRL